MAELIRQGSSQSTWIFISSARLALWPAIVFGGFAFAYLLDYDRYAAGILLTSLCITASIGFLVNDALDTKIDAVNQVERWCIRGPTDVGLLAGAFGLYFFVAIVSYHCLTIVAFSLTAAAMVLVIAYSVFLKRLLLVGNMVAAVLSIAPGLVMLIDANVSGAAPNIRECSVLLALAFLLFMSREIKFDEADKKGDLAGGRVTVAMIFGALALNTLHTILAGVSLTLLFIVLALHGKHSLLANLVMALIVTIGTGCLIFHAYRSNSEETFYKVTRLVMFVIPLSIFLGF